MYTPKESKPSIPWDHITLDNERVNIIVLEVLLEVFGPEFSIGTPKQKSYVQNLERLISEHSKKAA